MWVAQYAAMSASGVVGMPCSTLSRVHAGVAGKDNARQQIFDFVRSSSATQQFLVTALEDRRHGSIDTDDRLYRCTHCPKTFRQFSQLMQHQGDKHGSAARLALGD